MPEQEQSPSHKALGRVVKELRERAGLSQAELAKQVGIDPSYLSGLERGRRNPSWSVLVAIADELGTTPAKIAARADRLTT